MTPLRSGGTTFEFQLATSEAFERGEYSFTLHVELKDYPTSTPAKTTFLTAIDPCIITSLQAPANLNVTYLIEDPAVQQTVQFNFAQSPCAYGGTYTARMVEGTLPSNV